jgi:hypothetical protein
MFYLLLQKRLYPGVLSLLYNTCNLSRAFVYNESIILKDIQKSDSRLHSSIFPIRDAEKDSSYKKRIS